MAFQRLSKLSGLNGTHMGAYSSTFSDQRRKIRSAVLLSWCSRNASLLKIISQGY